VIEWRHRTLTHLKSWCYRDAAPSNSRGWRWSREPLQTNTSHRCITALCLNSTAPVSDRQPVRFNFFKLMHPPIPLISAMHNKKQVHHGGGITHGLSHAYLSA
jgi:hypothetical protein